MIESRVMNVYAFGDMEIGPIMRCVTGPRGIGKSTLSQKMSDYFHGYARVHPGEIAKKVMGSPDTVGFKDLNIEFPVRAAAISAMQIAIDSDTTVVLDSFPKDIIQASMIRNRIEETDYGCEIILILPTDKTAYIDRVKAMPEFKGRDPEGELAAFITLNQMLMEIATRFTQIPIEAGSTPQHMAELIDA